MQNKKSRGTKKQKKKQRKNVTRKNIQKQKSRKIKEGNADGGKKILVNASRLIRHAPAYKSRRALTYKSKHVLSRMPSRSSSLSSSYSYLPDNSSFLNFSKN
jgi:hypothetical protein